jgi:hypothetical protein
MSSRLPRVNSFIVTPSVLGYDLLRRLKETVSDRFNGNCARK